MNVLMKTSLTLLYLVAFLLISNLESFGQDSGFQWFQSDVQEVLALPIEQRWNDITITTASRTEESTEKALAMTRVITAEQIKWRGYQTLLEVLEDLPDFKISNQSEDVYFNNITLRGVVGQEKFVVLLDGIRISSPTNEKLPLLYNYPVHLAQQIEVVYGPASALYGADALAGVINIITKKPKEKQTLAVNASGNTAPMYNGELFFSQRIDPKSVITFAANYGYDAHPDYPSLYENDPTMDLSGMESGNFNTAFGPISPQTPYDPNFDFTVSGYSLYGGLHTENFQVSVFKNFSRTPSSVGLSPQNAIYTKDAFYGHHILMGNISYSKNIKNVSLLTSFMGSTYEVDKESNFRNIYVGLEPAYKYALGSELKLSQDVYWQVSNNINVIGGVTFERFFSIPKSADLDQPVDKSVSIRGNIIGTPLEAEFFNLEYFNFGSFGQVQVNPSEALSLTLGSRFDYNSRFGATFNPRLGVVWQPAERTTLKAFYGSSFLAPSPEATYEHYGSFIPDDNGGYFSFFWHLPNPDLEPIRSNNFEVGFQHNFNENLSVQLSTYYNRLTNLYNTKGDSVLNLYNGQFLGFPVFDIEIPVNEGEQNNYGGTLQIDYKKQWQSGTKLLSYLAMSYLDGTVDETENGETKEIGMISPLMVKGGVDIGWKKFSVSSRFIYNSAQRVLAFEENGTDRQTLDGYLLINCMVRYEPIWQTAVFLKIHNLLDQRYRGLHSLANRNETLVFNGSLQQPIRLFAGLQLQL